MSKGVIFTLSVYFFVTRIIIRNFASVNMSDINLQNPWKHFRRWTRIKSKCYEEDNNVLIRVLSTGCVM